MADPLSFDVDLTASTFDPSGLSLAQQFETQLSQFVGTTAEVLGTTGPFRVDSSGTVGFEMRRMYRITENFPTP